MDKKLSTRLIIGIILFPVIFSWFTLKKGYSNKAKILSLGYLGLIVILVLTTDPTPPQPTTTTANTNTEKPILHPYTDAYYEQLIQSSAVSYQVINSDNLSHATRSRYNTNIFAPQAQTKEQQLATAAKAAKEIQLKNRVQVSSVNLMIEEGGGAKVSINYAPDQKGWVGDKNLGQRFLLD